MTRAHSLRSFSSAFTVFPLLFAACGGGSDADGAGSAGVAGSQAGASSQGGGAGKAGVAGASGVAGAAGKAGSSSKAGAGGQAGNGGGAGAGAAGAAGAAGIAGGKAGSAGAVAGQAGAGGGKGGAGGAGQAGQAGQGSAGAAGAGGAAGCVCNVTPAVSGFSTCAPGKSFELTLDAACNATCDAKGACVVTPISVPCPAGGDTLPTSQPYQLVLRQYLAARKAADFDVLGLTPEITFDANAALSDDELYRLYQATFRSGGFSSLPRYEGLLIPSTEFLLPSLAATASSAGEGNKPMPRTMIGRESLVDPIQNLFYARWSYAGNPFFAKADAIFRRAFVATAGDLMMMDEKLTANPNFYSWDIATGGVVQYAAVAAELKSQTTIDACTVAAFDVGVRRVLDRLAAAKDLASPNADMVMGLVPALLYAQRAYPSWTPTSKATIQKLFADNCHEAGYCTHRNGAYDASYEGWTLEHLGEAGLLSDDAEIATWVTRFSRLKAVSTFVDPAVGGAAATFIGPSHFSNSTSQPAAQDQADYRTFGRDVAIAMTTPAAQYLVNGGRDGYLGLPSVAKMKVDVKNRIKEANGFAKAGYDCAPPLLPCPSSKLPPWQTRHYPGTRIASTRLYQPGTYAAFTKLTGDATKVPTLGSANYLEPIWNSSFPVFVAAKQGALASLVHVGRVDADDPGAGFGGGALSAVATEATGPVILGWNFGMQAPDPFKWSDVAAWPTHALSGSSGGVAFSSARLSSPTVSVDQGGASVTVSGDLSKVAAGAISQAIDYSRTFSIAVDAITVTTQVTGPASVDGPLSEVLPLLLATDGRSVPHAVRARTKTGAFVTLAPGDSLAAASIIEIARAGGKVSIELSAPATVTLDKNPTENTGYQWKVSTRNLRFSLGAAGALGTRTLSYVIKPG